MAQRLLALACAIFFTVCLGVGLFGCSTTPTQQQQVGITVLVDAAVAVAVQNGTQDQTTWTERATKIVTIVDQLQQVDSGNISTVQGVTAVVAPLVAAANLSPPEQLLAQDLIAALAQVIAQNTTSDTPTLVTTRKVLNDVRAAASVYIPKKAT